MSDEDKHFEATRRLARHQAEREWLRVAYETLERQRAVLNSLAVARENLWESTPKELNELAHLQTAAARIVIAQCESIMRHSGLDSDALAAITPAASGDQGAAREETVPW